MKVFFLLLVLMSATAQALPYPVEWTPLPTTWSDGVTPLTAAQIERVDIHCRVPGTTAWTTRQSLDASAGKAGGIIQLPGVQECSGSLFARNAAGRLMESERSNAVIFDPKTPGVLVLSDGAPAVTPECPKDQVCRAP